MSAGNRSKSDSAGSDSAGGNPGNAGPKGALGLPTAINKKRGRNEDKNEQRNFVTLSDRERKRTRREGSN